MSAKVFVDTNIWVYAKVETPGSDKHHLSCDFLKNNHDSIVISTQVINEYYNVLLKNRIPEPGIQKSVYQILTEAELSLITFETIVKSWEIRSRYNYSVYDSLIVASAIEAGCTVLYSEDLQHRQLIESKLRIINPFI